jgi:ABC-2 type transport system permease protein
MLTSPATKLDILLGYALAFALLALVQSSLASFVALGLLNVTISGPAIALVITAVFAGVLGMSYGLFFSAFAKNEFQAVQFMPAFVLPQFLTCGLFVPRERMPDVLRYFSDIMPVTYVVKAAQSVIFHATITGTLVGSLAIAFGFVVIALGLGAFTLRSE